MASQKESPRQKMIGMMYLVLTALLAMNVSKEVLNAFVVVNESLEETNFHFDSRLMNMYSEFDRALDNDRTKVQPYWIKADLIHDNADSTYNYIENLKKQVIKKTIGLEGEVADSLYMLKNIENKDNYDIPTQVLIGSDETKPKEASVSWSALELKKRLENYKEEVLSQFKPDDIKYNEFDDAITFHDVKISNSESEPWHLGKFYHIPLAAVVTNLSQMQNEVRNLEADAVAHLYRQITLGDYNFDQLAAKVIPTSNYVLLGDTFKAEVFVAAYSSTQDPLLEIGGSIDDEGNLIGEPDLEHVSVEPGSGKGIYSFKTTKEGLFEWGGKIKVKKSGNEEGYDEYVIPKQEFLVAKPALVVSPIKMNAMYRGLLNPVEVSLPGVPSENLQVTVTNGSIASQSNGVYYIKPGNGKETKVSVIANVNGTPKRFDGMKFRVFNIPRPDGSICNKFGDVTIQPKDVYCIQGIYVKLNNFLFDVDFECVSFEIEAIRGTKNWSKKVYGNKLSASDKKMLQDNFAKSGARIYFSNIIAEGPNGKVNISPSKFTVK